MRSPIGSDKCQFLAHSNSSGNVNSVMIFTCLYFQGSEVSLRLISHLSNEAVFAFLIRTLSFCFTQALVWLLSPNIFWTTQEEGLSLPLFMSDALIGSPCRAAVGVPASQELWKVDTPLYPQVWYSGHFQQHRMTCSLHALRKSWWVPREYNSLAPLATMEKQGLGLSSHWKWQKQLKTGYTKGQLSNTGHQAAQNCDLWSLGEGNQMRQARWVCSWLTLEPFQAISQGGETQ